MNPKRRKKFAVAVYLSVAAIGLALIFGAVLYVQGIWRDITISLAANFLGVGLLFFLVNLFFGLDSDDVIGERLRETVESLEKRLSILTDSAESRKRFETERRFESANRIDLLGYSLSGILYKYHSLIAERVKDGAKVRVLVINPKSHAVDVIKENSDENSFTFESDLKIALTRMRVANELIVSDTKKTKGSFEVRLISWIPSCTLVIVNAGSGEGKMTVAINSPSNSQPEDRPYLILDKREHAHWFEYYEKHFDVLWRGGQKWDSQQNMGNFTKQKAKTK